MTETVGIVGVGLIGGSLGAAAKKYTSTRVIGCGRNEHRLADAAQRGLIDDFVTSPSDLVADMVVVCTPVDCVAADVLSVGTGLSDGSVITDAGSVKNAIVRSVSGKLPAGIEFVGAHPLAGSEKKGHEHSDAELFRDRVCVVTPEENNSVTAVERVTDFWTSIGMTIVQKSPQEHDQILAITSHLPHAVASALATMLEPAHRPFAASGFRDSTRIAAGDPALWAAIFAHNAEWLSQAIRVYRARLDELADALDSNNREQIMAFLERGKASRDSLTGR